jgi:SAM-dependent methyltransferase
MPTLDQRHAPATLRNREPLLAVLARLFGRPGLVLEIASGTGEHAAFFAGQLPHLVWQPTDYDTENLPSIAAWTDEAASTNVRPPLRLDASAEDWPVKQADYLLCVNMIHIAPREAMLGLVAGAARVLGEGAAFVLYGPYRENGAHTAPSNASFDESLRARDPRWGVRDLEELLSLADEAGFAHEETVRMPANNLTVVLRRR